MRFNCKVKLKKENKYILIPTDYRKYISSMIKEAFKLSGKDGEVFLEENFTGNKSKPYTFSVYFPVKTIKDNNFILKDDNFLFSFSSNDYEFLMRIYNGLLKIKNGFKLFGTTIKVENFNLKIKPDYTFTDKIIFKTLSPFLLRNSKREDNYLVPEGILKKKTFKYVKEVSKEEFFYEFKNNIIRSVKKGLNNGFRSSDININILWDTIKLSPALHSSNKSNFLITLPALRGFFEMQGEPEVLKFIYDTGIGARRNEGFGMVEVNR